MTQAFLFDLVAESPQVRAGTHTCVICGRRWKCEFPGPKAECPRVIDPRCLKCS